MAANTQLSVSELDFAKLKNNIKSFLKTQSQFADYNFEGSSLSTLLDVLSYFAHYNSFYANMIANELFLDSGLLRDSVVSRAKELNYTPTSTRSAVASVNITIEPNDTPSTITIPRGTLFTTIANNITYTFQTETDYTITPVANVYSQTVNIYEGIENTERYTVAPNQRFIISNPNVDTSSLQVSVQNSNTDPTTAIFSVADDINEITGESKVYFLQETEGQKYEVYFGDDTLGKSVTTGNIVNIRYRIASGSIINGANTFAISSTISGYSNIDVDTVEAAGGGSEQESIDSIKFRAPKQYEIQNRAVTARDFERIILKENPDISSISVWGGEDNIPPVYGTVFASAKPVSGTVLSKTRKESIISQLSKRNVLTVNIKFEDPLFMYINISTNVKYNPTLTLKTEGQIKTTVLNEINNFETNNIGKFNKAFRISRFQRAIDSSEQSILSNEAGIILEIRKKIDTSRAENYQFDFNRAIFYPGTGQGNQISSTNFTYNGYTNASIADDGLGKLFIFYTDDQSKQVILNPNIGTIDYTTGYLELVNFNPSAVTNNGVLYIRAIPDSKDIIPEKNQILLFGSKSVTVTPEADEIAQTTGTY